MGEHRWTEEHNLIRTCQNTNCSVRIRRVGVALEQWQAAPRHHWHPAPKAGAHGAVPVPPCKGDHAAICSHTERVPVALNPGHHVAGGFKVGRCERPALPRMVVCERHATPDALRIVILMLEAELARNSAPRQRDNPSEPAE